MWVRVSARSVPPARVATDPSPARPPHRGDIDALTLTADGEVPRAPRTDGLNQISQRRATNFGKAALTTGLALDSLETESSPPDFLALGRKLVPGWAVSLLGFALLAPVLVAALDGFARARRRSLPIGRWMRWTLASGVPFLVLFGAAFIFELLDWLPATASEAISPPSRPSFAESLPALCALGALFAIAWLVLRPAVMGAERPDGEDAYEEAIAVALILSIGLLVLAVEPVRDAAGGAGGTSLPPVRIARKPWPARARGSDDRRSTVAAAARAALLRISFRPRPGPQPLRASPRDGGWIALERAARLGDRRAFCRSSRSRSAGASRRPFRRSRSAGRRRTRDKDPRRDQY